VEVEAGSPYPKSYSEPTPEDHVSLGRMLIDPFVFIFYFDTT
jgi:hypothetical protein